MQYIMIPARADELRDDHGDLPIGVRLLQIRNNLGQWIVHLSVRGIDDDQLGRGQASRTRRLSHQPLPPFFQGHHRLLIAGDMKCINLLRDRQRKPNRLPRDDTPAANGQEHDRWL